MIVLKMMFAALFPALLGWLTINIFSDRREDFRPVERIALGFCLGLVMITAEMFYILPVLSVKYSVASISLPLLVFMAAGLFMTVKNRMVSFKAPDFTRIAKAGNIEKFLLVLILAQVLMVSYLCMVKPVSGWDAWEVYSLRAKAYYLDGTCRIVDFPPTHRGQHVALQQTWVFCCIGGWNEILGKMNFPLFYLALMIIFYCAVRRTNSRTAALLATYMLSSLPFLFYHSTLEYCDFSLALYLFAGVSLMFRWFSEKNIRLLWLAAIFLLSTSTIKDEALFHLTMFALVFLAVIFSGKMESAPHIRAVRKCSVAVVCLGALALLDALFIHKTGASFFAGSIPFRKGAASGRRFL